METTLAEGKEDGAVKSCGSSLCVQMRGRQSKEKVKGD